MNKLKKIIFVSLQSIMITSIVCFAVCPISCKISETGIEVIGGDYVPPVLESVNVIDDKTVKCYISNEELEEFDITYKDFILRSEKAKEVVEEITGYAIPRLFAENKE